MVAKHERQNREPPSPWPVTGYFQSRPAATSTTPTMDSPTELVTNPLATIRITPRRNRMHTI